MTSVQALRRTLARIRERFDRTTMQTGRVACVLTHWTDPRPSDSPEWPRPTELTSMRVIAHGAGICCPSQRETQPKAKLDTADKPFLDDYGCKVVLCPDGSVIREGFSRFLQYFGNGELWVTFRAIAADAALCIDRCPGELKLSLFPFLRYSAAMFPRDHDLWVNLVFELCWHNNPDTLLAAERYAWVGDVRFQLDSIPMLRQVPLQLKTGIEQIADPPDRWYSIVDDLPNASVIALDYILDRAELQIDGGSPRSPTRLTVPSHGDIAGDVEDAAEEPQHGEDAPSEPTSTQDAELSRPSASEKATKKPKRSHDSHEANEKLISVLTAHHDYDNRSVLVFDPIGCNELARRADVSKSTASAFFKRHFDGHRAYRAACVHRDRLIRVLQVLNREDPDLPTYGRLPPNELLPQDD